MKRRSTVTRVVDGLHRIKLGFVSAYLLETDDGLVLIDCGEAGRGELIAKAATSLGRAVGQISHILVTHHHPDHTGSLADMARQTGASAYVHPADAGFVRGERTWPGLTLPGVAGRLLGPVLARISPDRPEPVGVDHDLQDEERLAIAGDAATNIRRVRQGDHWLGTVVTADRAAARSSFHQLADLEFEVAVFGHGSPVLSGASEQFRAARR